jgi:hypothetical protein
VLELLPSARTLPGVVVLSYGAALVAMTTLASLYCSRHFEVDA